jgi:hypothetical protein
VRRTKGVVCVCYNLHTYTPQRSSGLRRSAVCWNFSSAPVTINFFSVKAAQAVPAPWPANSPLFLTSNPTRKAKKGKNNTDASGFEPNTLCVALFCLCWWRDTSTSSHFARQPQNELPAAARIKFELLFCLSNNSSNFSINNKLCPLFVSEETLFCTCKNCCKLYKQGCEFFSEMLLMIL